MGMSMSGDGGREKKSGCGLGFSVSVETWSGNLQLGQTMYLSHLGGIRTFPWQSFFSSINQPFHLRLVPLSPIVDPIRLPGLLTITVIACSDRVILQLFNTVHVQLLVPVPVLWYCSEYYGLLDTENSRWPSNSVQDSSSRAQGTVKPSVSKDHQGV